MPLLSNTRPHHGAPLPLPVRVGGEAPAEEGRAEVDGDAGEPDDEQREHHTPAHTVLSNT